MCQFHHSLLHEGGYTIERANSSEQLINEQFEQQRHTNVAGLFDFEKDLRNDRESFDTMRKLQPTRYRFIVKNAQGVDIRTLPALTVERSFSGADIPCTTDTLDATNTSDTTSSPDSYQIRQAARAACSEPKPATYHYKIVQDRSVITTKMLTQKSKTNAVSVFPSGVNSFSSV